MAQPLSTAADIAQQDAVRQLCEQLEFFQQHPPLEIRPLAAGQSNLNYYLRTARGEYVLRRYARQLGICRQQEFRCQQAAAAKQIAATPLLLHNHQQLLISEFLPGGEPLQLTDSRLSLLADTLAILHNLRVQTPLLQPASYLRQLLAQGQQSTLQPAADLFAALQRCAEQLAGMATDLVLCHLDLHADNLLWNGDKIWLLDFEYSQLCDNSFDLAAIMLHFELTAAQQQRLLRQYSAQRRYPDRHTAERLAATLPQRLQLAKCLYSGFCWLWYQATPALHHRANSWQQRLQQLLQSETTEPFR
ncbi:MAG: phosphotransferase [Alishewanella aestuarii]